MKIALLGTGFGQAHAAVYAARPDVNEVVVFGRTPEKLAAIAEEFGFATTTDLAAVLTDAERILAAQRATGRRAFVDMFGRFSPANRRLREAVADRRHGDLQVLEIEGRTALLWPGYELGLQTLAADMMHSNFDLVTGLLGYPRHGARGRHRRPGRPRLGRRGAPRLPQRRRPVHQLGADGRPVRGSRRLASHLHRRRARVRHARRVHRPLLAESCGSDVDWQGSTGR